MFNAIIYSRTVKQVEMGLIIQFLLNLITVAQILQNHENCNYFQIDLNQIQKQITIMIPPQPPQQGSDLKLQGLTKEELRKIQKSMKRPEFMGLLNQYMVQISDPKNKAEYDEYLRQMQREGQLPKHMKLAKLTPEFCFKTSIISSRNKQHEMKFFVNMCSSEYIQKPSCEQGRGESGGVGYNWKVPNSVGKIRYDQDKEKQVCQVVDCAFHPDTFHFAKHPSFQAMIISIAIEGAEKQLGERKQTLSRDYVILKNVKCKGQNNEPALMPIRYIDGKAYSRGQGPIEPERNLQGKQTKLQRQINKKKQQYQQQKQKTDVKNEKQQKKGDNQIQQEDLDELKQKKLVEDMEKGIQAPKFTSIYTYKTDYSQFIDGPVAKKSRSLPNVFTVEFKVPRMQNISEANTLQINQKKIILGVQGKYYIDISFEDMKIKSYPLKHSEAKAKFDKKKKTLRVQIPVDISSIPEQQLQQSTSKQVSDKQILEDNNSAVVQNEVWKNKVLQIPQQQQVNKFLPQAQVQEQSKTEKKLIQQIDQDDYVVDPQSQKQKNQDEIQQKAQVQTYESRRFSISNYYNKPKISESYQNVSKQSKVEQLNYVYKQTKKFVTVMVYMRNYTNQQIKLDFSEKKGIFVLLWQNISSQPVAVHLAIKQNFVDQIKSIDIFKRVGYIALIIYKQKEEIWGQTCIVNLLKNQEKITVQKISSIINQITEQKAKIKEEIQIKQKQKQQIEIAKQNTRPSSNDRKQKNQEQSRKIQPSSLSEQIDENVNSLKNTNHIVQNKQVKQKIEQTALFQKLPIQFIKFNVPFIQTLN